MAGIFGVHPAQAGTVAFGWSRSFGGFSDDFAFDVYVDELGNVYSTGISGGIFINKIDNNGNISWFRTLVGSGSGFSIVVDDEGSVFVTGPFQGTVDFDPGAGTYNLTSSGGRDVFIIKLDINGNFVWAKKIGGASVDESYKIAVDQGGNAYVTGMYSGTVDFDPGAGTNNLTSAGGGDIFVCKLDTDGNFLWAKSMGGIGGEIGMSVALDENGNIYTTGGFSGTADFDPGVGEASLVSAEGGDGFISKLDSNGNFVWAQNISMMGTEVGMEIALDDTGYVFATGIIGPFGNNDVFLTKLNPNGDLVWVKTLGGSYSDFGYGIAMDGSGNVFITGSFAGTVDFDPGVGTNNLSAAGSDDIYISKLDNDGNFVWAKSLGGVGYDSGEAIAVDDVGNVYLAGEFSDTVDFDPGPGTDNLTSAGFIDAFISKFTFTPQIHYVKWGATGANNGTSWANAYTDLQSALSAASGGDEIWVAAGTYKPTTSTDRSVTFTLKNGVAIYGGFAGTETLRTQRNPANNLTILSGDIGVASDDNDNSYHVVSSQGVDNTAVLDGFTITAGNANSTSPYDSGGGMYNFSSNPSLTNLIFDANLAVWGGGIYDDNSSPRLMSVTFSDNTAGSGSGMFNYSSSPSLVNVTFSDNLGSPGSRGGAMVNDLNSSPNLANVTFVNNSVTHLGGGMMNSYDSNPNLMNVTFMGNSSDDRGGAIYNWSSDPRLVNVTISGNASNAGGALYNDDNSNPSIINSILYGDTGGEIYNNSGTAVVTYSIVQDGYPGTGNLDADPLLGTLKNNGGFTQTMELMPGSPAIDAGDDASCPSKDQRGVSRPQGAHCDMGAYEYKASTSTLPPYLKSRAIIPTSLITQSGSTTGSLDSLGLLQQNGLGDTPDAYVTFQTPGSIYTGYQSFLLPSDTQPSQVSTMLMQINFKGPASSTQKWTWSIYDWNTKMWIKLGDSTGTSADEWNMLLFRIQNPRRYILPAGEIRVQLKSNNANGDVKVDYEAIHLTYRPVMPSPTPVIPTVPPRRPGISSAPLTPTPHP